MKHETFTAWKVSKYGVISGLYFPVFGPEITPYLDTFHAVFLKMYEQVDIYWIKTCMCHTYVFQIDKSNNKFKHCKISKNIAKFLLMLEDRFQKIWKPEQFKV